MAREVRWEGSQVGDVTEPGQVTNLPGRFYTYTVTAVGADGQHSAESNRWVRLRRCRRELIPALAILAAVLATAGLSHLALLATSRSGTVPPPAPPVPGRSATAFTAPGAIDHF